MADEKLTNVGHLKQVMQAVDDDFIDNEEFEAALTEAQESGEFDGVGIASIEQTTTSNADGGTNVITITLTNGVKKTFSVKNGSKGSTGGTGGTGAAGVGVKSVEQTTTSDADGGTNVITVTLTDGTKATFNVKNGSKGSTGNTGPTGAAATIEVGTVTTGAAGSNASVTNAGTENAAKFNFTIPRGATGATGTRGSMIYWGTAITGTSTTAAVFSGSGISSALVNDLYLNTSTWNVYQCTTAGAASAAKWKYVGNIKGATGAAGSNATVTVDSALSSTSTNPVQNKVVNSALSGKADKNAGIFYIVGSGDTEGTWLGTCDDITAYFDGLTIAYKVAVAGLSGETTLNINSLGAVTVVRNATTAISTAFPVNSVVLLTYTKDDGTAYWKVADYDSNTKTTTSTTNKTGTKLFLAGATTQGSGKTTYSNSYCYVGTDNCLYSGGSKVLTSATDTKNTAGSTDSSSKLFLIGATSQAANPQTYSHDTAYVGTDGCLYSGGTKVSVEGHTHSYAASSHNQAASTITAGTFAGQVVAKAGYQAAGTSLIRNTKLVVSETTPTNEGEIFWTYG